MSARLASEKENAHELSSLKEEREHLNFELETAQHHYDYEKAARLQYSDLPNLEKKLNVVPTGQIALQ